MTGQLSLRFDSIYCAVTAVMLAVFASPVSDRLGTRPVVVLAVAAALGGWAYALNLASQRATLRWWLAGVLVANVAATAVISGFVTVRPWQGAFSVLLIAVAIEVAMFAVSQAVALRRRPEESPA
ncbi:hypothetical protein [Actinoplanes sp. NPDC026619]|uniref:hypothetical protein n=1 Tax=Actinoplanes sp. NPDC026619 TaxID=3155798 RepID=UPI003406AD5D